VIQQSGWVLLDGDGVVRYVHRSTNPQNSFSDADLLQEVEKL